MMKLSIAGATLRASRLPSLLTACHSWQINLNDQRRAHTTVTGKGAYALQLRGVDLRAAMFDGARLSAEHTVRPWLVASPGAEEVDAPEDVPAVVHSTREYRGWRLSYRELRPEEATAATFRARLDRKTKCYSCVRSQLGEGSRTWQEPKLSQLKRAAAAAAAVDSD